MADWFLWIKAGHIVSMVAWMAGLFYLPRLFVYHTQVKTGSEASNLFCVMERRLLKAIMTPAMISTWVFGLLALWSGGYLWDLPLWMWLKLGLVVLLSAFHIRLAQHKSDFAAGRNRHSERYFRIINEWPTLLLLGIVWLVVLRPFG